MCFTEVKLALRMSRRTPFGFDKRCGVTLTDGCSNCSWAIRWICFCFNRDGEFVPAPLPPLEARKEWPFTRVSGDDEKKTTCCSFVTRLDSLERSNDGPLRDADLDPY